MNNHYWQHQADEQRRETERMAREWVAARRMMKALVIVVLVEFFAVAALLAFLFRG